MINAGIEYESVKNEIIKSNYKKIYNVILDRYEDVNDTRVIDPSDVVLNSLMNATSVACMLLTTTSLIINEQHVKSNFNKICKKAGFCFY